MPRIQSPHLLAAGPLSLAVFGTAFALGQDEAGLEYFESRIRPLIADQCVSCHGSEKQRSGLRLDSVDGIRAGGERGALFVPGDPEASLIVRAVRYDDPELQMPERKKLPERDIEAFVRWVEMGAPLPPVSPSAGGVNEHGEFDLELRKRHWSFQPIADPPLPEVADEIWVADPVDAFVLAGLEARELRPAEPADRRTWIRRLSIDLTGLPPSPAEIEAFLSDVEPGAEKRLVDRLLTSPRFGERWGRHWLDLMRYAETRGHEFDYPIPNAWQYRDYVIRALNADVPYDRFVLEHVAGDLLAEPRLHPQEGFDESVLATGFWFFGEEPHSPVDIRGDETERIANQVDTFSKAFLGLTVACARCHDHKFDAITQEDYYALSGFPLSSSYRQVRFDSKEHNRRIAGEMAQLERANEAELRSATARAFEIQGPRMLSALAAARDLLAGAETPPAGARVWRTIDLLFEDFEGEDYGEWTGTGDAFGAGPVLAREIPGFMGELGQRGERAANSFVSAKRTEGTDRHRGTLTSPPFVIERDYVHFLLGGGDLPGEVYVELLVDGRSALRLSGGNSNRMRARAFDLRKYRGRTASLRLVDDSEGQWGQIGFDHVVFSDDPGSRALDVERAPGDEAAWRFGIASALRGNGVTASELEASITLLRAAAEDPGDPFHALTRPGHALTRTGGPKAAESEAGGAPLAGETQVVLDAGSYGDAPPQARFWRQDGFGFSAVAPGQVRWGRESWPPIERVHSSFALSFDPLWMVLELAPGTETVDSLRLNWNQAGKSLRTRTFTLELPKLYYLVQGAGHAYAAVASHRTNTGPLHGALIRHFGETDEWRWIEQDLGDYVGQRLHVELTPADGTREFGVALIVAATKEPPLPPAFAARRLDWGEVSTELSEPIEAYRELFSRAAERLADEDFGAGPDDAFLARLLDRALQAVLLQPVPLEAPVEAALSKRRDLIDSLRVRSRTAPAIWDGDGVDEYLLSRGSHHSPVAPAERRFLEALEGGDPLELQGTSGRLELALRLVDPSNPFVARVQVNRVWHHLFGRGIASTVDNLGLQGIPPTHPELLDHLATRFREDGWSVKRLIRALVLSSTYRMSSRPWPENRAADPTNQTFHSMPVKRLEAEALRDSILAISGSLDPTPYGPGIPVHLTSFMDGRGRPRTSGPLDGAGRRSIYLSVNRNFLPPFFLVFDFPLPASPVGRRNVTNVPAQALTLLNDPFVLQEAERWAARLLARPLARLERIDEIYLRALGREPRVDEREQARAFLEREAATRGVAAEDLALWADLCHVLFNLKEFVFVR